VSSGQITLGQMRAKGMTMLAVSCDCCGRHGPAADCAADRARYCPRMQNPSVSIYELCRVTFPELPRWF
jgi:hypothetical protein